MITPASRRPRRSSPGPKTAASSPGCSPVPVRRVDAANSSARTPMSPRLTKVPSAAVAVRAESPCVSGRTMPTRRPEATRATATGAAPVAIEGRTNTASTPRVNPSATRARSPCRRPRATTARANTPPSTSSEPPRCRSTTWYEPGPRPLRGRRLHRRRAPRRSRRRSGAHLHPWAPACRSPVRAPVRRRGARRGRRSRCPRRTRAVPRRSGTHQAEGELESASRGAESVRAWCRPGRGVLTRPSSSERRSSGQGVSGPGR